MSQYSFNVILFGEAGVGKSSVINLLAGKRLATTSPDAKGCTMESKQYSFTVAKRTFNVWDTVGLNEPTFSATGYLSAIEKTHTIIQETAAQGGLNLLLFCVRGDGGRITQTVLSNYTLFYEVLCEKKIPIALVVTRLDGEARMEDWWYRNVDHVSGECGLKFSGHACVTGLPSSPKAEEARANLEALLLSYDLNGRYTMPSPAEWYLAFLQRLSIIPRPRQLKDKKLKKKQLERVLLDRCMMPVAVARRLAEDLTAPHK